MDAKTIRRQVKNVLQEVGKEYLTTEVGVLVEKKLLDEMNARLDQIDKYCQQSLEKQDKRARGIQSFVLQEVTGKIQNDLFNANITLDAVVEVLAEAGLPIENFASKIDAKKVILAEKRKAEADAAMKAEMERRAEEAKAKDSANKQEENLQVEQQT